MIYGTQNIIFNLFIGPFACLDSYGKHVDADKSWRTAVTVTARWQQRKREKNPIRFVQNGLITIIGIAS